jgi:chromosome partitioning protein
MTRTYAAVSNKGGAGKTTLVTLLAGEYALRGERVLLIDADNRQNLSGWWRLCAEKGNMPVQIDVSVASTQRSIEATIKDRGAAFDLIIIDAPGVDSSLQTTIIRSSQLVISPIQPAIKELEAAGQAVAAVTEINDQFGLKCFVWGCRGCEGRRVKVRVSNPAPGASDFAGTQAEAKSRAARP